MSEDVLYRIEYGFEIRVRRKRQPLILYPPPQNLNLVQMRTIRWKILDNQSTLAPLTNRADKFTTGVDRSIVDGHDRMRQK